MASSINEYARNNLCNNLPLISFINWEIQLESATPGTQPIFAMAWEQITYEVGALKLRNMLDYKSGIAVKWLYCLPTSDR